MILKAPESSEISDSLRYAFACDRSGFPLWQQVLGEVLASVGSEREFEGTRDRAVSDDPIPFEDIYLVFVRYARTSIRSLSKGRAERLSSNAWAGLAGELLNRIANIAATTTSLHFRTFVAEVNPASVFLRRSDQVSPSSDCYRQFVSAMLDGGLRRLLADYSVLGRLIATSLLDWIESTGELVARLEADESALAALFCNGNSLGTVVYARSGLSDYHHRGKTVVELEFSTGLRVFYKPRSLAIDLAFFQLVRWINRSLDRAQLRVLAVLDRHSHGWVEAVATVPCHDHDELVEYYYRAGILLCLSYMLDGTDLHRENVIANGTQPVLIDLEMLLQQRIDDALESDSERTPNYRAPECRFDVALATGLLPLWRTDPSGMSFDNSGLGGATGDNVQSWKDAWVSINTDEMWPIDCRVASRAPKDRVEKNPAVIRFHDTLCDGFGDAYKCVFEHRKELLRNEGILTLFRGCAQRVVCRATNVYARLIRSLLHPEFLRHESERSAHLECLGTSLEDASTGDKQDIVIGLVDAERRAIERTDVPYFYCRTDSLDLMTDDGEIIRNVFPESSYSRLVRRVRDLRRQDLDVQLQLIKASFYCRQIERPYSEGADVISFEDRPSNAPPVSTLDFVAAAEKIAADLATHAILDRSGRYRWIGADFDHNSLRLRPCLIDDSLYAGRVGLAIFLSAMYRITHNKQMRQLALNCLEVSGKASSRLARSGLGAAIGPTAYVYGLVCCSRLLKDSSLLSDATGVAGLITERSILRDRRFDVLSGSAGAILGLLALYRVRPDPDVLDIAIRCGEHLLSARELLPGGANAWRIPEHPAPLTGFAHGASGIAYALSQLALVTGDHGVIQAIKGAIDYEIAHFDSGTRNWSDLRRRGRDVTNDRSAMAAWCHGAAGIGFARLGLVGAIDLPGLREDLEAAIETTRKNFRPSLDHLCCGTFGRIDLLLEAGLRLSRPELVYEARQMALMRLQSYDHSGCFNLYAKSDEKTASPSLFCGVSGIGYMCLRLAYPEEMPTILLLQ
jgi:type 2 lantibiotic biosynthesis protein LanM